MRQLNRKELNQLISNFLQPYFDSNSWNLTPSYIIKSRECHIYKVDNKYSNHSLAIKHYHRNLNPLSPQIQFDAFEYFQDSMTKNHSIYRVPKVYHFDSHNYVVVMEWLNGTTLHALLWKYLLDYQKREHAIYEAGKWLNAFHQASCISYTTSPMNVFIDTVDQRIAFNYKLLDQPCPASNLFAKGYNSLQKYISENKDITCMHATGHGDFTPSNVLFAKSFVYGIDIWAKERRPVIIDLARMAVYLTIAHPSLLSFASHSNNVVEHPHVKVLLDGYGRDILKDKPNHFHIALLSEYLRRWIVIEKRPITLKRIFNKPYFLSRIKSQVQSLLAYLQL